MNPVTVHGEPRGASQHRRRGETPCPACAAAWAQAEARRARIRTERRRRLEAADRLARDTLVARHLEEYDALVARFLDES